MKLALGTAQFGLEYGIANQAGPVPLDEVKNIIRHAALRGIDTLDTAIAYGESESALGKVGVNGWNVITKLPALPGASVDMPLRSHLRMRSRGEQGVWLRICHLTNGQFENDRCHVVGGVRCGLERESPPRGYDT